jgi:hypothetical protein
MHKNMPELVNLAPVKNDVVYVPSLASSLTHLSCDSQWQLGTT